MRIVLVLLLSAASVGAAQASARSNMRDAANGIKIATGVSLQSTGLFTEESLESLNGLCAHENYCAGTAGTVLVQANGDVLRLYIQEPVGASAYRKLCAAALTGLAPSKGLDETAALVEAAFAVANLGDTSRTNLGRVVFYVEKQGADPAQCSMVRR